MKENVDLVSIIVPIYNVENFLKTCIDSILEQSYDELEIILVDDGSTDSSGKICDDFEKQDRRILVIHKENGGLSEARNVGIKMSKGKYIMFCDADDYIHHDLIKIMYESIRKHWAEICCCGYKEVDKYEQYEEYRYYSERSLTGEEALYETYMAKKNRAGLIVWNKLYKKSILDLYNIRFPVGKLHEDEYFTYKVLYKVQTVVLVECDLYFYRQRKSSITHLKITEKNYEVFLELIQAIDYFIGEKKLRLAAAALYYYVSTWWRYYFKEVEKTKKIELVGQYKGVIKKYVKKVKPPLYLGIFYELGLISIKIPYVIKKTVKKLKVVTNRSS